MINAKKKGNRGENSFSNWLQSQGIKAYKNSSSGGNQWKSDIHNSLDINFEVKTCKAINLKKCWYQTDRDSSLSRTRPMLAIHFDHMPDNEWLMVMHSNDWIELEKSYQSPKNDLQTINSAYTNPSINRDLSYALNQLKASISKVNKLLE